MQETFVIFTLRMWIRYGHYMDPIAFGKGQGLSVVIRAKTTKTLKAVCYRVISRYD